MNKIISYLFVITSVIYLWKENITEGILLLILAVMYQILDEIERH